MSIRSRPTAKKLHPPATCTTRRPAKRLNWRLQTATPVRRMVGSEQRSCRPEVRTSSMRLGYRRTPWHRDDDILLPTHTSPADLPCVLVSSLAFALQLCIMTLSDAFPAGSPHAPFNPVTGRFIRTIPGARLQKPSFSSRYSVFHSHLSPFASFAFFALLNVVADSTFL